MRGYLGSSARGNRSNSNSRPNKRGNGNEKGRGRRSKKAPPVDLTTEEELEPLAEGEFTLSENAMVLTELKKRPVADCANRTLFSRC